MARGFTEQEKAMIRQSLIDVFEKELTKNKLNKISIDEIVKKVGISKGAFYNFFPSKEMLFLQVLEDTQEKIVQEVMTIINTKNKSNKENLKDIFLLIVDKLLTHQWITRMSSVEFVRKLPAEYKERLTSQDIIDFQKILKLLNLTCNIPMEQLIIMVQMLLLSTTRGNDFGQEYRNTIKEFINLMVDNLIEEK